ncbi:bifunctional riboflavin kinase/FAD synthetase [Helicobacter cynogastricus]|uniref:bifunctional riboflavin kinase/FAD synthetase n=1 Tax=Helicobacter cynogastricus TaxID=329937 RepID=UPI000CF15C2B|nr:bifunctional riboflavin kinase/FAD synthetase [Helicobacter cynogastricus]
MQSFLSILNNENVVSLAIGKFDGVHLAHQHLLSALTPPAGVLLVDRFEPLRVLTPLRERVKLLAPYAQNLYFLPLEQARHISARAFMTMLCAKFPCLQKIVVGYDFKCAQGRAMGVEELRAMLSSNIQLEVIPQIKVKGIPLHSYHIKAALERGDTLLARAFLGRPYALQGALIPGQQIGRAQLYPTLNMDTHSLQTQLLPNSGVYVSEVLLNQKPLRAVSFVGHRLSTDGQMAFETHILDQEIPTPPPSLRVRFLKRLRDNRHFVNLQELKAQIAQDIALARSLDSEQVC